MDYIPKNPALILMKIRMIEEMLTYPWEAEFEKMLEEKLKNYRLRLKLISLD
jgi:hypothetical protein